MRRAISLAFDNEDYIRQIYKRNGVAAQSPIVPGTFGYDPQWRTGMSEYNPAKAKALLDTYGYVDRNGDGWREQPDGSPLVLEKAASPAEIERRQSEQWRRYMTAIGLKIEFKVAQWPELVKQSLAGTLMIWNFAWQGQEPDSDLFFSLAYGPNKGFGQRRAIRTEGVRPTLRASARAAGWPGSADRHARGNSVVARLHAVQVSSASHSAGSRTTVADRLSAPPVYDTHVGVSRYRRRCARALSALTMLGRILRISSLLTIALATVLTVWFIDLGVSPWIADRDRRAASVRDPRPAARHRVHHRRTDRSAAHRSTQCDRCAAFVVGRVMEIVHRVQHRSTMACEFP